MSAFRILILTIMTALLVYGAATQSAFPQEALPPTPHDLSDAEHWYPMECCHQLDCAEVTASEQKIVPGYPDDPVPHLIVTTKHGTVVVPHDFPIRPSLSKKNSNWHACMRGDGRGNMRLICLFAPPGM